MSDWGRRQCGHCNAGFIIAEDKPTTICPICRYRADAIRAYATKCNPFRIYIREQKQFYRATYWTTYDKTFLTPGMVVGYISPFTKRFFVGIVNNLYMGMRQCIQINAIKRPLMADNSIFTQHDVDCSDVVCLFKLCRETTPSPSETE